jgi:hypothetical protein
LPRVATLPGFATTLGRQLVIPLPCLSDGVLELTVEMTCGVQLAFERPHEFLCLAVNVKLLAVNVKLYVLHGNHTPLLDRCATTLPRCGV